MPGAWEEAKHPRATDGKFGEGGAPESPAGKRPKRATPAARAKIAAARAKVGAKAKKIVSDARMRAKATVLAAAVKREEMVAKAKASGKKLTPKQRERIAVARAKAKAKATDIVAKAKAKAVTLKGTLAKAKSGAALRSLSKSSAEKTKANETAKAALAKAKEKSTAKAQPGQSKVGVALRQAWGAGDLRLGRITMGDHLKRLGLSQTNEQRGGMGAYEVRVVNYLGGAAAQRNWDGVVDVLPGAAERLVKSGSIPTGTTLHDPAAFQVQVMWHEQLHGYGPGTRATYAGVGVTVEEISTEMAARGFSRDAHGLDVQTSRERLAYHQLIEPLHRAISTLHGVSDQEASAILEKASLAYKRRPAGPDVDQLAYAFASDIEDAGPKRGIADRLERELRNL